MNDALSGNRAALVRMHKTSRVLRRELFVDPTYLIGDDGKPVLFLHEFVEYQTKRGNLHRRHGRTVQEFDSEAAMVEWLEDQDYSEGHPGDLPCIHWTPEGWEGAA
jgi:hypothetical protein